MSDYSAIEWTDATWNPTTGCTKVSPGCANCYIERATSFRIARRTFDRRAHIPVDLHYARLAEPLHWRRPRRVFVNSLSDLFHEDVPDAFIDRVFAVMALAPQHTFQVLTKRPLRMAQYFGFDEDEPKDVRDRIDDAAGDFGACHANLDGRWPLPNVWLGVSVENKRMRDERIPVLLKTPAAVKFISAEPLLEDIASDPLFTAYCATGWTAPPYDDRLDWVIVGGESGPDARPFNLAWARSILTACRQYGVPVFVKQLGAHAYDGAKQSCDAAACCVHDYAKLKLHRKGGDPAEWPRDLRVRQFPAMRETPSAADQRADKRAT